MDKTGLVLFRTTPIIYSIHFLFQQNYNDKTLQLYDRENKQLLFCLEGGDYWSFDWKQRCNIGSIKSYV